MLQRGFSSLRNLNCRGFLIARVLAVKGNAFSRPQQSGRLLCTSPVNVGDLTSSSQAIEHASSHGHMYTDVDIVMTVQRILSAELTSLETASTDNDSDERSSSSWIIEQNMTDFVMIVNHRLHRKPSPAAVAMITLAFFKANLNCAAVAMVLCRDADFQYVFDVAMKCAERKIKNRKLWRVFLDFAEAQPTSTIGLSQTAALLAACPYYQVLRESVEDLWQPHSSVLIEELKVPDLVNTFKFFATFKLTGTGNLAKQLVKNAPSLSAKELGVLASSKAHASVQDDLAMVYFRRLQSQSDDVDLFLYSRLLRHLVIYRFVDQGDVWQTTLGNFSRRRSELCDKSLPFLISSLSNTRLNSKDFISEVVVPHLKAHGLNMTLGEALVLLTSIPRKKRLGVPLAGELCNAAAAAVDRDANIEKVMTLVDSVDALFGNKGLIVKGFVAKLSEKDWPFEDLKFLLNKFASLKQNGTVGAVPIARRMLKSMKELDVSGLVVLYDFLSYDSMYKQIPRKGVLKELISRVDADELPLDYLARAIRFAVCSPSSNKEAFLASLKQMVKRHHKELDGGGWVRVLEAWSSEGDCDKDIFLTANTACGVTQTWHPDLVARLICASARGGIVSRNLLMDLQQHGWGQKVISEMQFNLLVPFLMAYAEMTIHAHVMMDMVYKRLSDNYFAPNRRESPAILSAVKAAWCFALLGYRGDAFLRSALYSAGTVKSDNGDTVDGFDSLTEKDLILMHDLSNYALRERGDLQLAGLQPDLLDKLHGAAWKNAKASAGKTYKQTQGSSLEALLVDFVGGQRFIRRHVFTDNGYFVNYALQFDKEDNLVPFNGDESQYSHVLSLAKRVEQVHHQPGSLPGFRLTAFSGFSSSPTSQSNSVDCAKAGDVVVQEERQYGKPVRRLAIYLMPPEMCVMGTQRPRGPTLMKLLQLSSAGWTVAAISNREWNEVHTPDDRRQFLREKIFSRPKPHQDYMQGT